MEVLEIGGVKFVKASAVARELGYTSDYVGQLCRSGKINAQLVGRSWYVDRDSIKDHKQTRYRSTKKKSTEALKSALQLNEDDLRKKYSSETTTPKEGVVLPSTSKHFYKRDTVADSAKYTVDESELIPILKTKEVVSQEKDSKKVDVVHADAKKVAVKKTSNSFVFATTPKPKIQFTGNVTIADAEDADTSVSEEAVKPETGAKSTKLKVSEGTLTPVQPAKEKPKKLQGEKVSIRTVEKEQTQKLHVVEETDAVEQVAVRTDTKVQVGSRSQIHTGGELVVSEVPEDFENTGGRYNFAYITASLALSLAVGLFLIAFEQSFTTAGVGLISSYSFNISTVLEAFQLVK